MVLSESPIIVAEPTENAGHAVLDVYNNWIFKIHSDHIKIDTIIKLTWKTNGTTTRMDNLYG